jgi:hypothetical protein
MLVTTWILAAALAASPAAQEASDAPAADQEPAVSPYDALHAEHDAAMHAWNARYAAVETDAERSALFAEYPSQAFVPRFRALAEEHAGTPTARKAWSFVLRHGSNDDERAALEVLARDFLEQPEIGDVCLEVFAITPAARVFFEAVLAKSPDAGARGKACYALARLTRDRAKAAKDLAARPPDERTALAGRYGADTLAELEGKDADGLQADAEALFERVAADFADVPLRGTTLGAKAAGDLFELRNLQIGMASPDIEGEDVDGEVFRLSDYRGKVVVLDFWGDW